MSLKRYSWPSCVTSGSRAPIHHNVRVQSTQLQGSCRVSIFGIVTRFFFWTPWVLGPLILGLVRQLGVSLALSWWKGVGMGGDPLHGVIFSAGRAWFLKTAVLISTTLGPGLREELWIHELWKPAYPTQNIPSKSPVCGLPRSMPKAYH